MRTDQNSSAAPRAPQGTWSAAATEETAETVFRLLGLGFPLVHLRPVFFREDGGRGECNCDSPRCAADGGGKHPCYGGWSNKEERAEDPRFTDPMTWVRAPAFGVGIVTGLEFRPDRYLFLIDVDVSVDKKTGLPKKGMASLRELEVKLGTLPDTVGVTTGSGGMQLYFVTSAPLRNSSGRNAAVLAPDIDTRGAGGYGVAPPSMSKYGKRYAWLPGRAPWEIEVAQLPAPWAEAVKVLGSDERRGSESPICHAGSVVGHRTSIATAKRIAKGVVTSPAWVWAAENPDEVDRMSWMAFASNLVAACDGHDALLAAARTEFHRLSEGYATYSMRETDDVFGEAGRYLARGGGPHRWATMSAVPEELKGRALNLVEDVRREVFAAR